MLTCPTRVEFSSNLVRAWSPRIAPNPVMTCCAVANFANGFDESLPEEHCNLRKLLGQPYMHFYDVKYS